MAGCSSCRNKLVALVGLLSVALYYYTRDTTSTACQDFNSAPLTTPEFKNGGVSHRIVVVTDLDQHSLVQGGKKPTWRSFVHTGTITIKDDKVTVEWDEKEHEIKSQFSMGGRAMELSDLTVFDGKLLSIDDRTGIVYQITSDFKAIPWVFLNDGPGNTSKGLKGEWMTVKDCNLYVGGLGKEWTTTEGVFVNHDPMYIKKVSPKGHLEHVRWVDEYIALRKAAGVVDPGYMIHESAQWSEVHKKWFFLPRRVSENEIYTEATDEFKGSNLLIIASEDFKDITVKPIGEKGTGSRGFSSFQFVPGTNDELIVALKSEEKDGEPVGSYITVFNWKSGKVLLEDTKLRGAFKFEGIAFAF
ncbi:unnamed protein product [Bursaphelenchus xylophilus]|uniref:(pine wood nematode) hypothetical protein n=1 Tax=Bursaphelenchus xylophilus TaxID=6326 RepID=A0A1I7SQ15_BURXY|nr:unnamed protein product [Bursaphelenchus xylophilus]CAG9109483.1 unnamed protein product [Bursaphelenchus xylophilus]